MGEGARTARPPARCPRGGEPFRKLVEKASGFELAAADILAAGEHLA